MLERINREYVASLLCDPPDSPPIGNGRKRKRRRILSTDDELEDSVDDEFIGNSGMESSMQIGSNDPQPSVSKSILRFPFHFIYLFSIFLNKLFKIDNCVRE